jgi:hypothetical protein
LDLTLDWVGLLERRFFVDMAFGIRSIAWNLLNQRPNSNLESKETGTCNVTILNANALQTCRMLLVRK